MPIKLTFMLCLLGVGLIAADTGDDWIDVPPRAGRDVPGTDRRGFESLKAEVIIGKMNVFWRDAQHSATEATLLYSPEHPGHWAAREWRELPMRRRQNLFDAKLPVTDVDLPIVYFVSATTGAGPVRSPARMVIARHAGMEKPSSVFWPFVEGFENGARNWSRAEISTDARSGNHSLRIRIPADRHSASVSTTRVRGWHFIIQRARAIRVWLKASKPGKAQFILTANASTTEQSTAQSRVVASVDTSWQAVDLPLNTFPLRDIAGIDLFTIEFIGNSGSELFIDDLQFLGRWRVKGL